MIDRTILLIGGGTFFAAIAGLQLGSGLTTPAADQAVTSGESVGRPASTAAAPTPAPAPPRPMPEHIGTVSATGEIRLNQQGDGHFYTQLEVGGTAIPMVVDTGASMVALTEADAARAGIRPADASFNQSVQTAGGRVLVAPVMLERVRLGHLELNGVQAVVVRGTVLTQSLLGQSVLNRLDSINISGGQMRLR